MITWHQWALLYRAKCITEIPQRKSTKQICLVLDKIWGVDKLGRIMMYQYLLFDLEGTLTDPDIGITNSVIYALHKFDIDVGDRSVLHKFIGPPLKDSFKRYYGFSDEQSDLAIQSIIESILRS